jgi:4-methyl-5(b-hydroxyethyl)-thiazole monophosphate biosynthesis
MSQKSVLVLLAEGFEEIEAIAPIDVLRRAGARVVLAALGEKRLVRGRCAIAVESDVPLAEVENPVKNFDLLLIPGGPAVASLRRTPEAARLAREFAAAGRLVGAICAAPLILLDAGLLAGRRFTAHDSTLDELPAALLGERVVRDGNIITSRGMGTALDFALELARALFGEDTAARVVRDIMA